MANYDLFIKGIRPDRLDEAEQIKKKASQFLKTDVDKLDALWGTPNGFCIRRNIESEEAKQIQATLAKAGLICLNRPAAVDLKFSLVAKEEDEEKTLVKRDFVCPYCGVKTALDAGEPDPIKCPDCSGVIAKYLEAKERKEIRDRLMNSKIAMERREMQLNKEEEERQRKKKIEQEVAEEIFGKKTQVNKTLLIAGGAAILIVSGLSYFLSGNKSESANTTASTTASAAAAAPSASAALPGQPGDAQAALQDTHDKANKVLGAFGLDADKLGKNAGGGAPASGTTKLVSVPPSASPSDTKKPAPPEASNIPAATVTLLNDGENNQEWDLFLNQRITSLIESNKLADAYKSARYLIDTEDYINTMGVLLAHAQQSNQDKLISDITTAIEARINSLPVLNQAEYLAQAGFYQLRITKKNDLLTRAEAVWKQIPNPDAQLKAALKIAVYNFKSDNVEAANIYFGQADSLLAKNTSSDQQVSARAAIGRAYSDVNDGVNAGKWLASTEKFIPEVTTATLKELIGSYAYSNQLQTATLQNIAKEKQGELLYRAVQVSLKGNAVDKAMIVSKDIQDSTYKALASDLIASYDPNSAEASLNSAEKELETINLPSDKAIVASRLSRHYARMGNTQKAAGLLKVVEQQLGSLSGSNTRDDVLAIVIKNFAQALQFDTAENLTIFIQAEAAKSSIKNDINRLKEIGSGLNL